MKVLVLDRDGVINEDSPDYIKSPGEWHPIRGSIDAVARASQAGYRVAVASNQSGVGRGLLDLDTLSAIHAKMIQCVEDAGGVIDVIAFCPHRPDENCECRKPKIGLLNRIASEFGIDLRGQVMVGDSLKDILAAREAGMQAVLVRTGNGEKTERELETLEGVRVFNDLAEAVNELVKAP